MCDDNEDIIFNACRCVYKRGTMCILKLELLASTVEACAWNWEDWYYCVPGNWGSMSSRDKGFLFIFVSLWHVPLDQSQMRPAKVTTDIIHII